MKNSVGKYKLIATSSLYNSAQQICTSNGYKEYQMERKIIQKEKLEIIEIVKEEQKE